jgi:tetrapyrrole methylase family protein/MazG family protein
VNLSRFLHVDAEVALNGTNRKFCTRFMTVEKLVKASGRSWATFSLAELDEFWNEAKRKKKAEK